MANMAADVPESGLYISPCNIYIYVLYMRTNELPSLACLLYISFALLFVSIFWPPTPRLGQQQPQLELPSNSTVPYIISPLYTKAMCVPYTF